MEPFRGQQYDKISRYDNNIHAIRFQQYNKISRHHKKLGVPWTDPTFPANDSSIGLQKVKNAISDLDMLHSINASPHDEDDENYDCNRFFFRHRRCEGWSGCG